MAVNCRPCKSPKPLSRNVLIEIVLEIDKLSSKEALVLIIKEMSKRGILSGLNIKGKNITPDELINRVNNFGEWSFEVSAAGLSFQFGSLRRFDLVLVHLQEQVPGASGGWKNWLEPFLWSESFVQAWVSDVEFDHWQNAKDLSFYTDRKDKLAEVKIISNNLPPPLTRDIVDVSNNPGRRVLKQGYVECVGLSMWLGRNFWQKIGGFDIKRLQDAGWRVSEESESITLLESEAFDEKHPKFAQELLRSALYS